MGIAETVDARKKHNAARVDGSLETYHLTFV